ncbi:hypothetical protein ACHWQZ_G002199 [Mnemiopsis leidyi]
MKWKLKTLVEILITNSKSKQYKPINGIYKKQIGDPVADIVDVITQAPQSLPGKFETSYRTWHTFFSSRISDLL